MVTVRVVAVARLWRLAFRPAHPTARSVVSQPAQQTHVVALVHAPDTSTCSVGYTRIVSDHEKRRRAQMLRRWQQGAATGRQVAKTEDPQVRAEAEKRKREEKNK